MSSGTNKQRLDQNNAKIEQLTQALNNKVIENTGFPIEVSTSSAMDALLVSANVGKVYKFTGTTDANYTNGDLYIVESFNSGYVFKKFIQTYNIANILSNCSTNNADTYIQSGQAYSATLSASTGYTLTGGTVSVTMNGIDITSTAYNNGVISIASVTGNIVISVIAVVIVYSITNSLSNCTSSNNAQTIQYGSSYTATITANTDYTLTGASVSITMGGVDITSTAYSSGTISIASVTGDLAITISAVSELQENFITFSSASPFNIYFGNNKVTAWDSGGIMEYSTDKVNWSTWGPTPSVHNDIIGEIYSASDGTKHNLYLRGTGITGFNEYSLRMILDDTTQYIDVTGNMENLLDYATVAQGNHPPMAAYAFSEFFYTTGGDRLRLGPSLSSTTIAIYCYNSMFYGCINLITLSKLPALNLINYGYASMYRGCSQIKLSEDYDDVEGYTTEYRIPETRNGTIVSGNPLLNMFTNTGGTFTGTPIINTTYYTSNQIV